MVEAHTMNPYSPHPSQNQTGQCAGFVAATAELFKPIEEVTP